MGERTRVNFNYHPSFSLNALDTLDIAEGKRVGAGENENTAARRWHRAEAAAEGRRSKVASKQTNRNAGGLADCN